MHTCPICREHMGVNQSIDFDTEVRSYNCPRCGRYQVSREAEEAVLSAEWPQRHNYLISAATRRASDARRPLLIKRDGLEQVGAGVTPPRGPIEAMDRLLLMLRAKSAAFGERIPISRDDYPLLALKGLTEWDFVIVQVRDQGFATLEPGNTAVITLKGWTRLGELAHVSLESSQAFVAMWFAPELEAAWSEGFAPGITDAGFSPVRVDLVEHNGKICDRIIAEIRRSGLLVADFTGQRGGVYFEAGYAMGLGIPVIWTCRHDDASKLHFDTRQYNHIIWQTPQELREKLRDRILATVARPA